MDRLELDDIRWHDLPLDALTVSTRGITLVVSPYDEHAGAHVRYRLWLGHAKAMALDVAGELAGTGLADLEVSTFSWTLGPDGLLTGRIGILAGDAGFWEVRVTDAQWDLREDGVAERDA